MRIDTDHDENHEKVIETVAHKIGWGGTRLDDRAITTYRVSTDHDFVTVTRFDDARYPTRWMAFHEGALITVSEVGEGEPPQRLFPYPFPLDTS